VTPRFDLKNEKSKIARKIVRWWHYVRFGRVVYVLAFSNLNDFEIALFWWFANDDTFTHGRFIARCTHIV